MSIKDLPNEIRELIPSYLENRVKEYQRLCELLTHGNLKEINQIGHKLAGNAGSYGLVELGKLGEQLEYAKKLDDINQLLENYKKLLQGYRESL